MKVFVIGPRGFPGVQGGVEKHCQDLYLHLSRLGCDITVFARKSYFAPNNRVSQWQGIKFIYLNTPRQESLETIVYSLHSALICLRRRPDIVHLHSLGAALVIPLLKLFGLKVVFTYHSINYHHQKWSRIARAVLRLGEMFALNMADRIIVVSLANQTYLAKKFPRIKTEHIANGVVLAQKVTFGPVLKQFGLDARRYIFTAARFAPEKGLDDLIAAYAKIESPGYKLVIAGGADYENSYSQMIKEMAGKVPGVVLTGMVYSETLAELYSNAGLFVLPSHFEGMPIALLEALSYGLAVLVSDIPQNKELGLFDHRYYLRGDVQKLSVKIQELMAQGISQEEQKFYYDLLGRKYNWSTIAQKTEGIYKTLERATHDRTTQK